MQMVAPRHNVRPPRQSHANHRAAFTLVELLVVLAIIGVLVSFLLPVLAKTKEKTRETQCLNNLRNQGLMQKYFRDDFGVFPPARIRQWNATTMQWERRSTIPGMGGIDPLPGHFASAVPWAVNRPLAQYQTARDVEVFHCPLDRGHLAFPTMRPCPGLPTLHHAAKPSMWETIGCSYLYNGRPGAPVDPTRTPPMPPFFLHPLAGFLPGKPEEWVNYPSRYILANEPPAQPLGRLLSVTPPVAITFWSQWHRSRSYNDFVDPTIAPPMFISPVLFVDGHVASHDFSKNVMTDPFYPYEETKDWIWYQRR